MHGIGAGRINAGIQKVRNKGMEYEIYVYEYNYKKMKQKFLFTTFDYSIQFQTEMFSLLLRCAYAH